jgi:UDP-glucuronate decarboxylase
MNNRIKDCVDLLKTDSEQIVGCFDFDELTNKTIIITGASGLIGVNFISSLKEISKKINGLRIIPIIQSDPSDFLKPFLNQKGTTSYQGNLTDENFIDTLPMADIIVHAAGFGQPVRFTADPLSTLKLNTITTFKLFDKLKPKGKFLFISSSEIYNGLKSERYTEDQIGTTNTSDPRACYIEGKRTGETICNLFQAKGFTTHSIRLSLTYGPGSKKGDKRVLPSIIEQGLQGEIELLDSGTASRTYCYISDAIELMWYVLLHGKKNLYNIGGNTTATIKELALNIAKKLNAPVIIPDSEKSLVGAPANVNLNMDRILSEYPKKKFVSLDEGLTKTIDWYRHLNH